MKWINDIKSIVMKSKQNKLYIFQDIIFECNLNIILKNLEDTLFKIKKKKIIKIITILINIKYILREIFNFNINYNDAFGFLWYPNPNKNIDEFKKILSENLLIIQYFIRNYTIK